MHYVKRSEWGARSPRSRSTTVMDKPSTGHWNGPKITVGGKTTWDHSKCSGLVRGIQNFHMDSRRWSDIAYNFLVCPHGYVFEGRGLNVINAANGTKEGNRTSHGIMWLAGDGNVFNLEEKQAFKDCVLLVAYLLSSFSANSSIPHSDHHPTQCPGNDRRNWIRQGMPIPVPSLVVSEISYPDGSGGWRLHADGGVFTWGTAPFYGSYPGLPPEARQGERTFVKIEPRGDGQPGYVLISNHGERYVFPSS